MRKELSLKDLDEILQLEEELYWLSEPWHALWEREARGKFAALLEDYLRAFPKGCVGLIDEERRLQGALFLTKLSEVKAVPYVHGFSEYYVADGPVAYVEIFVVRRGASEREAAVELYREAEAAARELKCAEIAVVIYSSPLEEETLLKRGYRVEKDDQQWEIYPGTRVGCRIYTRGL